MAMTTKTPQQIHNLREALEVWWPSVPEANVMPDLGLFVKGAGAPSCNTVACFIGWAGVWPPIRAQGIQTTEDGYMNFNRRSVGQACDEVFGDPTLWLTRGAHQADAGFTGTDHALVTNRLRWALEH